MTDNHPSLKLLKSLVRQRLVGFDVPASPHFESIETTNWFVSKLSKSRKYLEYGSGGSTYLAAKCGVSFVSVETDRQFLKRVVSKIKADGLYDTATQSYRYRDIGFTGKWGWPVVLGEPSFRQLEGFRRYSDPPVESFSDIPPDLVLIDGRFRVACALKAARLLGSRSEWTIAFDDYVGRPQYHVIARYARLDRFVGRMAIFNGVLAYDPDDLESMITAFETVAD